MNSRTLYVYTNGLPYFKSYIVKDSDQRTVLYKAKIRTYAKPNIRLANSTGTEVGTATYANDEIESCTSMTVQDQQFDLHFDKNGPEKGGNSLYWMSPTYNGTVLVWTFTDMRTHTCCIEGDLSRPVAVMTRAPPAVGRDVGTIEVLNWSSNEIDEIVLLALTEFQRFMRMLRTDV